MKNNIQTHRSENTLNCHALWRKNKILHIQQLAILKTFSLFRTISFFKKVHNYVIIKKKIRKKEKNDNLVNLACIYHHSRLAKCLILYPSVAFAGLVFQGGDDVPVPARFLSPSMLPWILREILCSHGEKENNNTRAEAPGDQACGENKGVKKGKKKLLLVFA